MVAITERADGLTCCAAHLLDADCELQQLCLLHQLPHGRGDEHEQPAICLGADNRLQCV